MSSEEPPETEAEESEADEGEDIRYFVRIGQTDLDGTKSVERALGEMHGIGRRAARIIATEASIDRSATLGLLDEADIEDLIEAVQSYDQSVPDWMTNRQNGFYTGESVHEVGNDLSLSRDHDINRMRMIRSYKGVRHERGQKVRGQRTKSAGRTEGTIGVNIQRIQEERAEEEAGE